MTKSNSEEGKGHWSKSVEKNGITTSINVSTAENGFVVEINRYGYEDCKEDDESLESISDSDECVVDKREWISETKKYISSVNPLAEDTTSMKEQIMNAIKSIKL